SPVRKAKLHFAADNGHSNYRYSRSRFYILEPRFQPVRTSRNLYRFQQLFLNLRTLTSKSLRVRNHPCSPEIAQIRGRPDHVRKWSQNSWRELPEKPASPSRPEVINRIRAADYSNIRALFAEECGIFERALPATDNCHPFALEIGDIGNIGSVGNKFPR